MPMHPSPSAETSRPCLPSLRRCIIRVILQHPCIYIEWGPGPNGPVPAEHIHGGPCEQPQSCLAPISLWIDRRFRVSRVPQPADLGQWHGPPRQREDLEYTYAVLRLEIAGRVLVDG